MNLFQKPFIILTNEKGAWCLYCHFLSLFRNAFAAAALRSVTKNGLFFTLKTQIVSVVRTKR
jgi:hypothetical protein